MKNKATLEMKTVMWMAGLALLLAATSPMAGDDVLARLNLTPAAAKENVLQALASGTVYNDAAYRVFKALPVAARATVVTAGLGWIKAYVANADFQAAYRKLRESEKPEAPAARPSADDELKKMRSEMEKNIAEIKKNMAAMDAETKKTMEAAIREMRAQMDKMGGDPQQREYMRQAAEMTAAEDKKRHEEELKEWERHYPADPRALIKKRIGDFLVMSAGVDFSAKLTPRGDRMIFVREDYEQKPSEWKLCFRAGKEATAAARAFAESWLLELEKR